MERQPIRMLELDKDIDPTSRRSHFVFGDPNGQTPRREVGGFGRADESKVSAPVSVRACAFPVYRARGHRSAPASLLYDETKCRVVANGISSRPMRRHEEKDRAPTGAQSIQSCDERSEVAERTSTRRIDRPVEDYGIERLAPNQNIRCLHRAVDAGGSYEEKALERHARLRSRWGMQSVWGIDVGDGAAGQNRPGHDTECNRGASAPWTTGDLGDASLRKAASSEQLVETGHPGGYRFIMARVPLTSVIRDGRRERRP